MKHHHPNSYCRLLPVLCLTAALLAGCEAKPTSSTAPTSQPQGQSGLATTRMMLGGREFTLEIADTDSSRQTGLMFRDSMPVEHGMIFAFDNMDLRGFWMKNTLINLDIVYLDSQGKIVSIHTMYSRDLRTVPSKGPAQYAIELNEGIAKQLKLAEGDQLQLPPEVTKAR